MLLGRHLLLSLLRVVLDEVVHSLDQLLHLPVGEHAGWLHLTRARNLFVGGLTATGPSHKSWANLEGGALTLYEERVRGEARVKTVLSLDGAVAKAPPSSKRVSRVWFTFPKWIGRIRTFIPLRSLT